MITLSIFILKKYTIINSFLNNYNFNIKSNAKVKVDNIIQIPH